MDIKKGDKVKIRKEELSHNEWEVMAVGMNLPEGSACIQKGANLQIVSCDQLEVVEDKPVIECGDTVKKKGCTGTNCEVLGISAYGSVGLSNISNRACACHEVERGCNTRISDLTLIHKGPKVHVFEGVQFSKVSTQVYPYMHNPEDYRNLSDNGKTYRMKLEEVK